MLGVNQPVKTSKTCVATAAFDVNYIHRLAVFSTNCHHRLAHVYWVKDYSNVIMGVMAAQITSLTIVYSTVYSGADQRKLHSSVSLAFVRGIHRWPVDSPHKWPVTRKMFQFDDVIMRTVIAVEGWNRTYPKTKKLKFADLTLNTLEHNIIAAVLCYLCCKIWFMRRVSHGWVSMVVADGLIPI